MCLEIDTDCTEFSIKNETTGETMSFTDLPSGGLTVNIDLENQIITESKHGYNLYDYFNFVFLSFIQGDNKIKIAGNGTVSISGRYLYNVGA